MADTPEIRDRNRMRRQMAQAAMLLTWITTLCFLSGLFDNGVAERVEKVWPPFAVLFPSLMAYIGFYSKLGSDETKRDMELRQ